MDHQLTAEDRERIKLGIQQKYAKVAAGVEGNFRYPTGRAGLEGQKYDPEIIGTLPEDVVASYCGVGNPFILGSIHEGDTILDVGCGAGVDTLIAATMAGPKGKAVGIDLIADMVARAKQNLGKTSLENVEFEEASAESLSFPDESFDVVISNGVINLIPDKAKALKEIFRVLIPNGRLMIADQVLVGEPPGDTKSMVGKWAGWQGGAISGKDFLTLLVHTGFADADLVAETGFNSSAVTKGVLFRALKSVHASQGSP